MKDTINKGDLPLNRKKQHQRTTKDLTSELMQLLEEAMKQGVFLIEGSELLRRLSFKCGNIMALLSANGRKGKIKEELGWDVVWEDEGKSKHVYLIHKYDSDAKKWRQCRNAIRDGSPNVWAKPRKFFTETLIEHVLIQMHKTKSSAYPVAKACHEVGCSLVYFHKHLRHKERFKTYLKAGKLLLTKRADNGRLLFVKNPES